MMAGGQLAGGDGRATKQGRKAHGEEVEGEVIVGRGGILGGRGKNMGIRATSQALGFWRDGLLQPCTALPDAGRFHGAAGR